MISKVLTVQNRAGIHARPSALLAQTANKFQSNIMIEYNGTKINAKSIMGIMAMAAGYKTELTVYTDGADENEALAAIEQLFENKFEDE